MAIERRDAPRSDTREIIERLARTEAKITTLGIHMGYELGPAKVDIVEKGGRIIAKINTPTISLQYIIKALRHAGLAPTPEKPNDPGVTVVLEHEGRVVGTLLPQQILVD